MKVRDTDLGRDGWFNCGVVVLGGILLAGGGLIEAGIKLFG